MDGSFRQLACKLRTHSETHNSNANISTRVVLLAVGLRSAVNDLLTLEAWRAKLMRRKAREKQKQ